MKLIIVTLLVFLTVIRAGAETTISQPKAQVAPANVLAQMKTDGHSVRFQQVKMGQGQGEVFCHLYMVDKTYFLDIFRAAGAATFHRLNSVDLGDTPHSQQLRFSFMWLQPKHYRGPILRLYDQDFPGEWDASWDLIVFPDGFEGRVVHQSFLEKIIGGEAINPSFDSYDEQGLLVINLWDVYETHVVSRVCLFWNGQGFAQRKSRYAVISPLFKKYTEAQSFLRKPIVLASDQVLKKPLVLPTRYYQAKGLKPGCFVVILQYLELQTDAEYVADTMHQQHIPCSVLRLY